MVLGPILVTRHPKSPLITCLLIHCSNLLEIRAGLSRICITLSLLPLPQARPQVSVFGEVFHAVHDLLHSTVENLVTQKLASAHTIIWLRL